MYKPSTQKYIQLIFIYIEDIIWRHRQSVTDITQRQLIFIYIDIDKVYITSSLNYIDEYLVMVKWIRPCAKCIGSHRESMHRFKSLPSQGNILLATEESIFDETFYFSYSLLVFFLFF